MLKNDFLKSLNLDLGDYGEQFTEYKNSYISDIVSEIADSNTAIYYNDIMKWFNTAGAFEYVERAVKEGFVDMHDFDIYRAFQAGQFLQIEEDLNEHLEDSIINAVIENSSIIEIADESVKEVSDWLYDNVSNVEELDDIIAEFAEFMEQ